MDEMDTKRLFDELKSKPCLWDSSSEYYKERQMKKDGWHDICKILIFDWNEKSNGDKENMGTQYEIISTYLNLEKNQWHLFDNINTSKKLSI